MNLKKKFYIFQIEKNLNTIPNEKNITPQKKNKK